MSDHAAGPPQSARSGHLGGVALMVGSTFCFAANALLVRQLGRVLTVNVFLLASMRFLVGLGILGLFFRREFQPRHLLRNPKLVGRGLMAGVGVIAYYGAIVHIGAARSTFINSTYVFWAALLAAWVFRERLRPVTTAGALAALGGIALLTGVFTGGHRAALPYEALAVLSALGSAYVAITIRQLHATEHTATIFGAMCVFGLLLCGPFALFHLRSLSLAAWGLVVLSGVCVAGGQLAQTRAYRELPVAEGSLLQMLSPLLTAVGGVLCFGEEFNGREVAGAALILAGTAAAALRRPAT